MVYGRIFYNNIKEYTPKWFPTIPYAQTVKPVFGAAARKPQVVWATNSKPATKTLWRNFAWVFQRHSFMWQFVILGLTFITYHICRDPLLALYQANNVNRTYKAAIAREKAYKKSKKDQQDKEEAESSQ